MTDLRPLPTLPRAEIPAEDFPASAVRKTDTAEVRVSRNVWKGRRVVDIRIWYRPNSGAEFVPSRKGLTIDSGKLPELIGLLTELA